MKTTTSEILAASAVCVLALGLGCDPDEIGQRAEAIQQRAQQAGEEVREEVTVADRKLMDSLQRANARIDMAAREALASAEDIGRDVAGEVESGKDEFVTESRERLRRLQLEMERIHARTDRRIDELDATLDQDRERAEVQLERLIDETQEGYVQARDAIARELDELEARVRRFRERIDDEV